MTGRRYAKDAKCPQTGKRQFTEKGANLALEQIAADAIRPDDYMENRAYRCPFCDAYHLTHRANHRAGVAA